MRLCASDDTDVQEMMQTYTGWIEKVKQAVCDKRPVDERFETYLKKRATRERKLNDALFTVRRKKMLKIRRELRGGELGAVDNAGKLGHFPPLNT